MTVTLKAENIAAELAKAVPGVAVTADGPALVVPPDAVDRVCAFLKNTPELSFDYLQNLTSVDYWDYFEVVYHLTSIKHNHSLTLKVRCYDREKPAVASVTGLWRGADIQEREVYDLMGVSFTGHPNLKRILLWEGFPGHPLRRNYL